MRCDYCGGSGEGYRIDRFGDVWESPEETCEECSGIGGWCNLCHQRAPEDTCQDCQEGLAELAAEAAKEVECAA